MNDAASLNETIPTGKVFKDREVWVGTSLGGPLAAGYLIAENYKTFGESGKARKTLLITVAATFIIMAIALFAPYIERVPIFFFALIYTVTAYSLFQAYQGEKVKTHITRGGQIFSWRRTIGVSVIGIFVTLSLFVGVALIADSAGL